jgi:hypothetical protein
LIPLALTTKATVFIVVLAVIGGFFLLYVPLRLWWRLRQGDDEPEGSDGFLWRRKKKETPEDFE